MPQALIIDDNHFNIKVLAQYLQEEGFDSIPISNPEQLEDILDSMKDVQIVFLDLEMPEIDGFEVIKMLRTNGHFSNVPIIAHSVHSSQINLAHNSGFNGFIGKPLNEDKFPQQLAHILEGKNVWETT